MVAPFFSAGWQVFAPEPAVTDWVRYALADALRALRDPSLDHWYQCERTWFVGLDALSNDAKGCIGASGPLAGVAVDFITDELGEWPALHPAQLSGVFPGYPRPRTGETEAAFRYRLKRDAAHVDGVIGLGNPKRRFVQEPHQFILGLPLTDADEKAAPLVVWEGSHLIMQAAFQNALRGVQPSRMSQHDVTQTYQAARKQVFDSCPRVIVHAPPGSAILVHRLALHGVAPWGSGARADPHGRLIAYFRPPMTAGVQAWTEAP